MLSATIPIHEPYDADEDDDAEGIPVSMEFDTLVDLADYINLPK